MSIKKKYDFEVDGSIAITGEYTLPTADGSDGQVMTTDGLGVVTFETPTPVIFEEVSNVIREIDTSYDNDFVIGSPQLDDDGNAAHDSRMFFDKSKYAVRAGMVGSTEWDDANRGNFSVGFGYGTTASGSSAVAVGWVTTATGDYSNAEGYDSDATGDYSHAEGNSSQAVGDASHAEGQTTANGNNSHSEGYGSIANAYASHADGAYSNSHLTAMRANASDLFSSEGDAQNSIVQVLEETTDATTTELTIGGQSVSASKVVLPANRSWGFKILVAARQTAGAAGTVGDSHVFEAEGGIKRDGSNNTALIGTPTVSTVVNDAGAAAWTVAVSADDTNESLKIDVTGEVNKTIHWSAKVELVEVG